jgi:YtkA-like protein
MNRFTAAVAGALAATLIAPASSLAGGFATVGLSSLPDGARPGEAWLVDLTVLQHGRTPLEGVKPVVRIGHPGPGTARRFWAVPTGEPGVYRAKVVFPSAGEWTYSVDDGFTQVHDFGTVRIAADNNGVAAGVGSATAGPDGGMSWPDALGIAAAAGIVASLGTALLRRRFHPRPAEG